ncbi:hypothetical protein Y1Q_0009902 [Alligator mississippiensis]|uniref:Uncharacterized protein n=1 Tax=Alligator mississippiensis TaxID=8496 RepID=A0A151MXB3_ALLMI|nr:hypothetical protein Y1Q_0009902 [Alligator mississippiensis]
MLPARHGVGGGPQARDIRAGERSSVLELAEPHLEQAVAPPQDPDCCIWTPATDPDSCCWPCRFAVGRPCNPDPARMPAVMDISLVSEAIH